MQYSANCSSICTILKNNLHYTAYFVLQYSANCSSSSFTLSAWTSIPDLRTFVTDLISSLVMIGLEREIIVIRLYCFYFFLHRKKKFIPKILFCISSMIKSRPKRDINSCLLNSRWNSSSCGCVLLNLLNLQRSDRFGTLPMSTPFFTNNRRSSLKILSGKRICSIVSKQRIRSTEDERTGIFSMSARRNLQ